jgi:DNA-binding CsgD family transcriptional regulator
MMHAAVTPAPPHTGERSRSLARIVRALHGGRGTLLLGAAGVGKTHLASLAVTASGLAVLEPAADLTARHTTPFAGLAELLRSTRRPASDAEATALLRTHLDAAGHGAVLLRVESAHLLDRSSAETIARLARRGDLVLLATARPMAGSMSPWHELWRDDVVDRFDLQDLAVDDAAQMLVSLLGGPVLPGTARTLWRETGGNPFHLRELVADQRLLGTLERRDGVWTLTAEPAIGDSRLAAAQEELHGLSPDALLTLQSLALLGPLRLSSVLDTVGRAPVEEVLGRGVVRTPSARDVPDVTIELAHRLLGHALRRTTPPDVARDILQRAAAPDAFLPLSPQTVLLMLEQGMRISIRTVRSALAQALGQQHWTDVVAIVGAALSAADVSDLDRVALLVDRGHAQHQLRRVDAAFIDLDDAHRLLRRRGDVEPTGTALPQLVARVTNLRAQLMRRAQDDLDGALAALADGIAWLARLAPRADRSRHELELEVARLTLLGYSGRHEQAQRQGLHLLDGAPDPKVVLPLACPTGLGLLQSGRFEDARRIVMRYRPLAASIRATHPGAASEIAVVDFYARLWSGEVDDLDGLASSALDLAHETIPWAGPRISRGLVAAAQGAWSPARSELHAANSSSAGRQRGPAARYGLAVEALAAAACGEVKDAYALLRAVENLAPAATAVLEGELRLLRLDTLVWLEDPAALTGARQLAEWARTQGFTRVELEALHRILVLRRWTDRATDLAVLTRMLQIRPRVRSARATALVKHARALQHDDVDLIEIAERELNRRGLWLPPGRQALALTHREREIAALAKARLTSRVIAARLGLSARTVDSHLASVFSKLGVTSREGLGHALT